jgi:hypothetical protein
MPQAGILYVTVDGSPVPDLPKDARGRSFLDLYADPSQWQARIPLVQGLPNGRHQIEISLADERNPASRGMAGIVDGFAIRPGSPPSPPYAILGLLVLGVVADLGWLTWELRRWRRARRQSSPQP